MIYKKNYTMTSAFTKFVIFFTLFVNVLAQNCTDYNLSSKEVKCVMEKNKRKCSLNLDTLMMFSDIGRRCLSYKYENKTVLDMSINYVNFYNILVLKEEYNTADWALLTASGKVCPGDFCNEDTCGGIGSFTTDPESEFIFQRQIGFKACLQTPPKNIDRFNKECGNTNKKVCWRTSAFINPILSQIYIVFSVKEAVNYPVFSVTIKGSYNFSSDFGGDKIETEKFNFISEGETNIESSKFKGVVTSTDLLKEMYYTDISPKDEPKMSRIGDIQFKGDNYTFDLNLIKISSYNSNYVQYEIHETGVSLMKKQAQKLPVNIGGNMYNFMIHTNVSKIQNVYNVVYNYPIIPFSKVSYGNILVSKVKKLKLNIKTKTPIEWTTIVDTTCPILKNISFSSDSCYNCDEGVKLLIKAQGGCGEGNVTVKIFNYTTLTKTLFLKKNMTYFTVLFKSNDRKIDGKLCLTDKYYENVCLNFKGILSQKLYSDDVNTNESVKEFFERTWPIWVIVTVIIVVLTFIGVVLFVVIKYYIIPKRTNKNSS